MKYSTLVALSLAFAASATPLHGYRASSILQNGKDATALNHKFASVTADSPCSLGEQACTTVADLNARITATGAGKVKRDRGRQGQRGRKGQQGQRGKGGKGGKGRGKGKGAANNAAGTAPTGSSAATSAAPSASPAATSATPNNAAANGTAANGGDPQSSLTLLQSVIATGFKNDGQDVPEAGQVPSLTSSNNFINFCATVSKLPITNGQQIKTGSCNPAPMGVIAATTNMPSSKFVFPKNGATIAANKDFTIQMAIKHIETGNFVNPNSNYLAAPQQVNAQGDIKGHSHVVIEKLQALDSTTPTDPTTFAFFKGLNNKDQGGVLSANVAGGLPAGVYRLASINAAENHQPVLVAVAQHGSLDDMVYFTVA